MPRPTPLPPPLVGDVIQLNQIVTFIGQRCQFSMYYVRGTTTPSHADATVNVAAVARAWMNDIVTVLAGALSVGTSMLETRTWSLKWPDVATFINTTGPTAGTRAGDPLPPQIAMVLNKSTDVRGKSGRGRMYICGMSETDSTNGEPNAAFIVVMNAITPVLEGPITDPVTGNIYSPAVVSLKSYSLIDPPPVLGPFWVVRGATIAHIRAREIWYTQRRRTFGVGQ